jgi:hypothetical protein
MSWADLPSSMSRPARVWPEESGLEVTTMIARRQARVQRRTVQEELVRRNNCRYGLGGVKVSIRDQPGQLFVILSSRWVGFSQLRLKVVHEQYEPAYRIEEFFLYRNVNGPRAITCDMAVEFGQRWKAVTLDIAAADALLQSRWPITCRCWRPPRPR